MYRYYQVHYQDLQIDSEMLTLLVAMDFFPYPGEQQLLGFIRANYLSLFPKLLV